MLGRRVNTIRTVDAIEKILPAGKEAVYELVKRFRFQSHRPDEERRAAYDELAPVVLRALGRDGDRQLARLLADPCSFEVEFTQRHRAAVNLFAVLFAATHVLFNPTRETAETLLRRLRWALDTAGGPTESKFHNYPANPDNWFQFPHPSTCLYLLSAHLGFSGVEQFVSEVLAGRFDREVRIENHYNGSLYAGLFRDAGLMRRVVDRLMQRRNDRGQFSYESFCSLMNASPRYLDRRRLDRDSPEYIELEDDYLATYRDYIRRFLIETVNGLPETAETYRVAFSGTSRLAGIDWIGRGLDKIAETGVKAKDLRREYEAPTDALKDLVSSKPAAGETEEQLVGMLEAYAEKTLLLALPYACNSRVAILRALGWHDILPVQNLLYGIAGGTPYHTYTLDDVPNGEDPSSGVLDRQHWLALLDSADEKRLDKYLKVIRPWGGMRKTMTLIDALRGEGRDKVDRALIKHGQVATKALGLFPVSGDEDLRERYLTLKRIHKEVTRYGSERQANSRAAVQAGLRNLAQAAGYPDEVRMEWELESDLADSITGLDEWHEIEQWRVKLELRGVTATIRIEKNGKLLKSVPAKVRKTDYYKRLRENQDVLRAQARRFRRTLENMMCTGDPIDASLLVLLKKHPALRAMIRQLILVNADGEPGLYDDSLSSLRGVRGAEVAGKLPLRIAHVNDLYRAEELTGWQRLVVAGHMVQPFKQAFRELYIPTPAEESAGEFSARFAGHVVDTAVAYRLMQSRGWSHDVEMGPRAYKFSASHEVTAIVSFDGHSRYFTEEPELTMGFVSFRRANKDVAFTDIDPLLFSETMRDADLVAAVAQSADSDSYGTVSSEVLAHRWAVLEALLTEIGLDRVTCKGRHAHVQGKLASYRVHLASGAIHVDPGNYLCVVPEGANKAENVYLPFADTDKKMAEILSKVLLLLNDDRITDKTILRQISRVTETTPA